MYAKSAEMLRFEKRYAQKLASRGMTPSVHKQSTTHRQILANQRIVQLLML